MKIIDRIKAHPGVYDVFSEEGNIHPDRLDWWVYMKKPWIAPRTRTGSIHEQTLTACLEELKAAKLALDPKIVAWLKRPALNPRSHAVQDDKAIRYFHPCGHTSWEPLTPEMAAMKVGRWSWDQGGVSCECPTCYKAKKQEAKAKRLPFREIKLKTKAGPDWIEWVIE